MARYIDADKLPLIFGKAINEFEGTIVPLSEVAIKIGQTIRNLPTADVVKVKHGKWETKNVTQEGDEVEHFFHHHSECKFGYSDADCCGSPYCPNCGAKMDGVSRMTDKEIIKALECCKEITVKSCERCPFYGMRSYECQTVLAKNAFALINRQKAEIERLQNEIVDTNKIAKAEAIKEFADRLKKSIRKTILHNGFNLHVEIDNLVKEMESNYADVKM